MDHAKIEEAKKEHDETVAKRKIAMEKSLKEHLEAKKKPKKH